MAQSKFPIPPEKLVKRAKEVLAAEFGTKEGSTGNFLAEDFQFVTWEKMDSSQTWRCLLTNMLLDICKTLRFFMYLVWAGALKNWVMWYVLFEWANIVRMITWTLKKQTQHGWVQGWEVFMTDIK